VLVVGCVSLAVALVQFWLFSDNLKASYLDKANEYLLNLQNSLKSPVWNIDEEGIKHICSSFVSNEVVASLRVTDDRGKVLYLHGDEGEELLFEKQAPIKYRNREVGLIQIGIAASVYNSQNRQLLITSLTIILPVLMVLTVATSLLLKHYLRDPIKYLMARMDQIARGKYREEGLTVSQREVESILSRFNNMARQIAEREIRLTQINTRLEQEINERRQALEALQESEERYRTLQANVPVGVFRTTVEGRFLAVNPTFVRLLGYGSEAELMGVSAFKTYSDPADRKRMVAALQSGMEQFEDSMQYKRKDGSLFWGQLLVSRVLDAGGNFTHMDGILQDISVRRRMQEELLEEKEFSDSLLKALPGIFYLYSSNGKLLRWNRNHETFTGYAALELEGKELLDWFAPGDHEYIKQHVETVLRTGRGNAEAGLIVKNGQKVPFYFNSFLFKRGGQDYICGFGLDISEIKRSQAELVRLSTAIENAAEEIVITDLTGSILYVNPAFERITGYSPQEALGQNPRILKSGEHSRAFYEELWQTISAGDAWTGRLHNRTKTGGIITQDATISPIRDESQTVIGYVAVKRDVTEQLKMEAQLRQAQKMEAIGTLAGGIAHDFNNILSSVIGFTELSLTKLDNKSLVEQNLDEVMLAGLRARDLVQQILTFSRQSEIRKQAVEIGPLVKEALKLMRASLPSSIELRMNIADERKLVVADPIQIHQVVMNLCTNAYQAMKGHDGLLEVLLRPTVMDGKDARQYQNLEPGEYLMLRVGDTGNGIPPGILERIFDPFFTTKERSEGTGLGLSVVHGIVQDMGGGIKVDSEPGRGSSFSIMMPVHEDSMAPVLTEDEQDLTGQGKILLVDDEPGFVKIQQGFLEELGYQVTPMIDSLAALEAFKAAPAQFDLLITDLTMPKLSGDKLAREVRKVRSDIPIVLCSGFSEMLPADKELDEGIQATLRKPVLKREMAQAVKSAINAGKVLHG
jgi:PAS domain S-box-containing protein